MSPATAASALATSRQRDLYADALRAGALLVVVLGHWLATLPVLEEGRLVATAHLLGLWPPADALTWLVQVVPVFVFVSGAVAVPGVQRRLDAGHGHRHWWAGRALSLARPAVTYLAVLAVLALLGLASGGRLLGAFNQSLTIHLWFLPMLLAVQACCWAVRATSFRAWCGGGAGGAASADLIGPASPAGAPVAVRWRSAPWRDRLAQPAGRVADSATNGHCLAAGPPGPAGTAAALRAGRSLAGIGHRQWLSGGHGRVTLVGDNAADLGLSA